MTEKNTVPASSGRGSSGTRLVAAVEQYLAAHSADKFSLRTEDPLDPFGEVVRFGVGYPGKHGVSWELPLYLPLVHRFE